MSAFEYAYRNADIAAEIGASFNGDGHLRPTTRRPEGIAASLTDQHRAATEHLMIEFRAKLLTPRPPEFKKTTMKHAVLLASSSTAGRENASHLQLSRLAWRRLEAEVPTDDRRHRPDGSARSSPLRQHHTSGGGLEHAYASNAAVMLEASMIWKISPATQKVRPPRPDVPISCNQPRASASRTRFLAPAFVRFSARWARVTVM